jgi:hypothetical protein
MSRNDVVIGGRRTRAVHSELVPDLRMCHHRHHRRKHGRVYAMYQYAVYNTDSADT